MSKQKTSTALIDFDGQRKDQAINLILSFYPPHVYNAIKMWMMMKRRNNEHI